MANNLFDPPSKEELNIFSAPTEAEQSIFAPPTKEELDQEESKITKTEAAAMGAVDSATLGFYDELRGLAGATGEKIAEFIPGITTPSEIDKELAEKGFTGDIKQERSLKDLYEEYRNIAREDVKTAQEEQPVAYYSGVAAGALAPGIGTLGQVAKGSNRLQQILSTGKAGAAIGAAGGLGTSEADLLQGNISEAAKDVAVGAGTGLAFGAGIPVAAGLASTAAKGIKKPLQKIASDSELGRDILRSYELGKEGKGIVGKAATTELSKQVNLAAKELQDTLFKKLDENFDKKLQILKSKKSETIDYSNLYNNIKAQIEENVSNFQLNPDEEQALLSALNKRFYEKLPEKIKGAVKTTETDIIDPVTGLIKSSTKTVTNKELPSDIAESVVNKQKSITEQIFPEERTLKTVGKEVEDVLTKGKMKGQMSLEEASNFVRDLQRAAFQKKIQSPGVAATMKKTASQASDILEAKAPETKALNISSSAVYDSLEKIGVNPNTIKKGEIDEGFIKFIKKVDDSFKSPESLAQQEDVVKYLSSVFGKDQADKMVNKIQKVSHDYLLGKRANEGEQIRLMSQLFGTIKDIGVKGTNVVGQLKGASNRSVEKIYNMSNDMLVDMAQKAGMDNRSSARKVSEFLQKASETKNQTTKNALLFSLIQNPEYRQYMKETFELDDKETGEE